MSGFGAMKKEEKEEEKQLKKEKKSNSTTGKEIVVKDFGETLVEAGESSTKYPNFEAEFMAQTSKKKVKPSSTFCTIVGHDGTGKTGLAMDAHMSKYTDNEMMWVIDHDNGGLSCKHAHYGDTDRIRLWSPWVYQDTDRTAYHYPKTHERIMGIMRYAIEYAEKQTEADFEVFAYHSHRPIRPDLHVQHENTRPRFEGYGCCRSI